VRKNGEKFESKYVNGGNIKQPAMKIGTTNRTGTTVRFKPDPLIFKTIEFNASVIKERIRESSFLYKGIKIIFFDENTGEESIFESKNGISEYVDFINDGKTCLNKTAYFSGTVEKIEVEIAFQYVTTSSEIIISFANSVKTKEGGSHETGFKSALTECINDISRK
jgi:topoisomerase-4 subunit B